MKVWMAVGLVACVAVPAIAQTGASVGGASSGRAATAGSERKTQLSPQEQLAEGKKHVVHMEQSAGGIRKMLSRARKDRDVVKTLCLNDKLSQADVTVRSGRERSAQLQSAVTRNDVELANHEFTILTVLRHRSEQVASDANQCVGEESAFAGETETTTKVASTIPPEQANYPEDDSLTDAPPCVTCTL